MRCDGLVVHTGRNALLCSAAPAAAVPQEGLQARCRQAFMQPNRSAAVAIRVARDRALDGVTDPVPRVARRVFRMLPFQL